MVHVTSCLLLLLLYAVSADAQAVLWFNMREEPVVYVNGLPFVLREQRRPLKNLQVGCHACYGCVLGCGCMHVC